MVAQSDDDEEEMDWEEGLACVSYALEKDQGSRLAPVPVGDDTCTTDILGEVQISRSWQGSKETGGHPEKYSSPQLRAASALGM